MQNEKVRLSPARPDVLTDAGPWGILQPMADGLKFLMKEEIIPLYRINFCLCLGLYCHAYGIMAGVLIPWGDTIVIKETPYPLQIADLNVGILYVFGVVSIGVYGIMIGGWALTISSHCLVPFALRRR